MNDLFAEVEVMENNRGTIGALPAENAVARVNALDWQQVGRHLDEQIGRAHV